MNKPFAALNSILDDYPLISTEDLTAKLNCKLVEDEEGFDLISRETGKIIPTPDMTEVNAAFQQSLNSKDTVKLMHAISQCTAMSIRLNNYISQLSEENAEVKKKNYPEDAHRSTTNILKDINKYPAILKEACDTYKSDENVKLRLDILNQLNSCVSHYEEKGQKKYVEKLKEAMVKIESLNINNPENFKIGNISSIVEDLNKFDKKNRILGTRLLNSKNTLNNTVQELHKTLNTYDEKRLTTQAEIKQTHRHH